MNEQDIKFVLRFVQSGQSKQAVKDAQNETRKLAKEIARAEDEIVKFKRQQRDTSQEMQRLRREGIQGNAQALRDLELRLSGAQGATDAATDELRDYRRQLREAKEDVQRLARESRESSRRIEAANRRINQSFRRVGVGVRRIGSLLAGFGLGLGVTRAISTLRDFEQQIARVRAVTGATGVVLDQLTATARRLGATTIFRASEVAEGLRFLSQAGFDANESLQAIEGTLNLAIAGAIGLGEAADITASSIRGFNLQASEAGRVADVLAAVATNSNTTIGELGQAIKFVSATAAALGIEFEETANALGVLANAGIKGTLAGTGLRRVLLGLSDVAPKGEKALRRLGLTIEDVSPQFNSLTEIIEAFREANINAREAVQLFGLRGQATILILTQAEDQFRQLGDEIRKYNQASDIAAEVQDNLNAQFIILNSAIEELILGQSQLNASLRTVIETIRGALQVFAGTLDPLDKNAAAARQLAEDLRDAVAAIKAFVAAFLIVRTGLGILLPLLIAANKGLFGVAAAAIAGTRALKAFRIALSATGVGALLSVLAATAVSFAVFAGDASEATQQLDDFAVQAERTGRVLDDVARARNIGGVEGLEATLALLGPLNAELRNTEIRLAVLERLRENLASQLDNASFFDRLRSGLIGKDIIDLSLGLSSSLDPLEEVNSELDRTKQQISESKDLLEATRQVLEELAPVEASRVEIAAQQKALLRDQQTAAAALQSALETAGGTLEEQLTTLQRETNILNEALDAGASEEQIARILKNVKDLEKAGIGPEATRAFERALSRQTALIRTLQAELIVVTQELATTTEAAARAQLEERLGGLIQRIETVRSLLDAAEAEFDDRRARTAEFLAALDARDAANARRQQARESLRQFNAELRQFAQAAKNEARQIGRRFEREGDRSQKALRKVGNEVLLLGAALEAGVSPEAIKFGQTLARDLESAGLGQILASDLEKSRQVLTANLEQLEKDLARSSSGAVVATIRASIRDTERELARLDTVVEERARNREVFINDRTERDRLLSDLKEEARIRKATLDFDTENRKRIADLQLEGRLIGLNNKQRERTTVLIEAVNKALADNVPIDKIKEGTEALNDQLEVLEDLEEASNTFANGFEDAADDFVDASRNAAEQGKEIFESFFGTLEDQFVNLVSGGEFDIKQFVQTINAELARITFRKAAGSLLGRLGFGDQPEDDAQVQTEVLHRIEAGDAERQKIAEDTRAFEEEQRDKITGIFESTGLSATLIQDNIGPLTKAASDARDAIPGMAETQRSANRIATSTLTGVNQTRDAVLSTGRDIVTAVLGLGRTQQETPEVQNTAVQQILDGTFSAKDFTSQNPEELRRDIRDEIQNIPTPFERVAQEIRDGQIKAEDGAARLLELFGGVRDDLKRAEEKRANEIQRQQDQEAANQQSQQERLEQARGSKEEEQKQTPPIQDSRNILEAISDKLSDNLEGFQRLLDAESAPVDRGEFSSSLGPIEIQDLRDSDPNDTVEGVLHEIDNSVQEAGRETKGAIEEQTGVFPELFRSLGGLIAGATAASGNETIRALGGLFGQASSTGVALGEIIQAGTSIAGAFGAFRVGGESTAPTVQVRAPIAAFAGAPRLQTGGLSSQIQKARERIGLSPGEIPAILHANEAVIPLTPAGDIPLTREAGQVRVALPFGRTLPVATTRPSDMPQVQELLLGGRQTTPVGPGSTTGLGGVQRLQFGTPGSGLAPREAPVILHPGEAIVPLIGGARGAVPVLPTPEGLAVTTPTGLIPTGIGLPEIRRGSRQTGEILGPLQLPGPRVLPDVFDNAPEGIFGITLAGLVAALGALGTTVGTAVAALGPALATAGTAVLGAGGAALSGLGALGGAALGGLGTLGTTALGGLGALGGAALSGLGAVGGAALSGLSAVAGGVTSLGSAALSGASSVLGAAGSAISTGATAVGSGLSSAVSAAGSGLGSIGSSVANIAGNAFGAVQSGLSSVGSSVGNFLGIGGQAAQTAAPSLSFSPAVSGGGGALPGASLAAAEGAGALGQAAGITTAATPTAITVPALPAQLSGIAAVGPTSGFQLAPTAIAGGVPTAGGSIFQNFLGTGLTLAEFANIGIGATQALQALFSIGTTISQRSNNERSRTVEPTGRILGFGREQQGDDPIDLTPDQIRAIAAARRALETGGPVPFARGGIARSPTLGLIAEAGVPEAVVPLPDGRAIPVRVQGGSAGGPAETPTVVNINYNITTPDADSFRSSQTQLLAAQNSAIRRAASRS
jgi:TP901 family phage tail tape measure protein